MAELTTNINLLQPSGFKVTIDRKNYPNLEFFAQSVALPSVAGDSPETAYRGMRLPEVPSMVTFGELTMNLLVDEDMNAYTESLDWLFRITNDPNVSAYQAVQNDDLPHRCDITLSILSSHNNVNKKVLYRDAFPYDVGELQLETTNGEQTYITVPVSFKYSRFEIV